MFLLNLLLALAWLALTGEFSAGNFAIGFLFVYLLLNLTQQSAAARAYVARVRRLVSFAVFFAYEVTLSSLRVAYEVLRPGNNMRPAIVAVPLDLRSDAGITLLGNLITLTPGTLTLDVSTDRRVIYVHAMYMEDEEAFRQSIKQGFERRIIEVLQ